jgi:esterase/lipase superfamily enzyme
LAAVLLAAALAACGPPPEIIGVDNPETPSSSVPDVSRHRIFITTTREATEVAGAFFNADRAPDLGLASVEVTIPPNHVTGEVERPKRLPPDPRTEFTIVDPVVYQQHAQFISEVRRELAKRPPGERRILLFVHGYNNTASDAILRLSQFVEDTDFRGVPILFTWASAAKAPRYVYDLNSALVARSKLKELTEVIWQTRPESISILAHSMGTFLTMEGLVDAQLSGRLGRSGRIDNIILASPDIDIDLFKTQVGILPENIREKIFLLVSKDDAALRLSRRIAGGVPRAGAANADELEGLGVTVIDLSQIEDSASGSHSKFAGSPEVVQLIGQGLESAGTFDKGLRTDLGDILRGVPISIFGD